ncbi:MAG: ABC transporter ATP-binding protein [Gemmatimonadota bacterium]|nr:ABC transporter ATP-binding protein [Gemmatimonadota bacterium]
MSDVPALEAVELAKRYALGDGSELEVLRRVDLRVARGESVAIVGESGCGKSTLLHILGLLDRPTQGEVRVGSASANGHDTQALAALRNRSIGFVFQFHHLLREFSALENAMMPALIAGAPEREARERARELLGWVGLERRLEHKPWQLSGGEQQRVAVARALVNDPAVLLADEPSGNLDERTSALLHDLLFRIRSERGTSMVIVTHNRDLAGRADRTLKLSDGTLHALGEVA